MVLRSARAEDHHHERATSTKGETPPHGSRLIGFWPKVSFARLRVVHRARKPACRRTATTNWTRQRSRNYSPSPTTIASDFRLDFSDRGRSSPSPRRRPSGRDQRPDLPESRIFGLEQPCVGAQQTVSSRLRGARKPLSSPRREWVLRPVGEASWVRNWVSAGPTTLLCPAFGGSPSTGGTRRPGRQWARRWPTGSRRT